MTTQNERKQAAAEAALQFVEADSVLGIGTGSTVNFFIDALAAHGPRIRAAVSSSEASSARLQAAGIEVVSLNECNDLDLYVDGADEANPLGELIKGGGGALTREKIVAAAARRFVCIIDDSKQVDVLGRFPLPVEVIPMARSLVARRIVALGGRPVLRQGFTTDNGNVILDIHDLTIHEPIKLEQTLNQLTGCVCNGLFAARGADVLIVAREDGVQTRYLPSTDTPA